MFVVEQRYVKAKEAHWTNLPCFWTSLKPEVGQSVVQQQGACLTCSRSWVGFPAERNQRRAVRVYPNLLPSAHLGRTLKPRVPWPQLLRSKPPACTISSLSGELGPCLHNPSLVLQSGSNVSSPDPLPKSPHVTR